VVTEQQVREALRGVHDPEIGRPIEDIGMLKGIEIDAGRVRVDVLITIEGCPLKDRITSDVTAALSPLEGVEAVEVSVERKTVAVRYDPARVEEARIRTALKGAGFPAA